MVSLNCSYMTLHGHLSTLLQYSGWNQRTPYDTFTWLSDRHCTSISVFQRISNWTASRRFVEVEHLRFSVGVQTWEQRLTLNIFIPGSVWASSSSNLLPSWADLKTKAPIQSLPEKFPKYFPSIFTCGKFIFFFFFSWKVPNWRP